MASGLITAVDPKSVALAVGETITVSSSDLASFGPVAVYTTDATPQAVEQSDVPQRQSRSFGSYTIRTNIQIAPRAGSLAYQTQAVAVAVQTPVAVPAFKAGDVTGPGGTNATVVLVATVPSTARLLTIDNTGLNDAEIWFGSRPLDGSVGQAPKLGKPLTAGAALFLDVRIPAGAIYATAAAATGLSVVVS